MANDLINRHITRVLSHPDTPATSSTIDTAYLAALDSMLTSTGLYPYLHIWTNPMCGVNKNGSNQIGRVFDLGTTRIPRLGDYTPETPSLTTYSATGLNSVAPAWVNSTSAATAYYGSARNGTQRWNNIRRLHYLGITLIGGYSKTHSNAVSLLGLGDSGGFYLQNTSGASGVAKMFVGGYGNAWTQISQSTTTLTNNALGHVIGGTFDTSTMVSQAYVEGVADGSPSAGRAFAYEPLSGGIISSNQNKFLGAGAPECRMASPTSRSYFNAGAQYNGNTLALFGKTLSPSEMATVMGFIRTWMGTHP